MKRLLFIAAVTIAAFSLPCHAEGDEKEPVILHVRERIKNEGLEEIPRSPIRRPSLYIEEHTLSFTNSCVGYTLELVQDDEVVYT